MDSSCVGVAIVVMGVSGSGKSKQDILYKTIAKMVSESLSCCFIEADEFHSVENKEKMSKGVPLTDDDRIPWLEALAATIRRKMISEKMVVVACSALQLKYRDILRYADADYVPGVYTSCKVEFVCVEAPMDLIADRMLKRLKDGKHFMPVSLLQSQFNLLHIDDAEKIPRTDATESLQVIVDRLVAKYKARLSSTS